MVRLPSSTRGGFNKEAIQRVVVVGARILAFALVGCANNDGDGGVTPPSPVFPYHQEEPAWSRQGLIAYTDNGIVRVDESGVHDVDPSLLGIWVIDPDTKDKTRILSYGHSPDWSPDGSKLSFVHAAQIYTMNADGSNVQQLTFDGRNFFSRWSPDGQWIAYDSDHLDPAGAKVIWLMRSDGTEKTDISEHGTGEWRMPAWSPDGSQILHVRAVLSTQSSEIFVMNMNGESSLRLTTSQAMEMMPQYSPDGTKVAYQSAGDGGGLPQIWLMNSDGSDLRQLTTQSHGGAWPSWSPDGQEIVYFSADSRQNLSTNGVLWIIEVGTGVEHQLTERWPEATSP